MTPTPTIHSNPSRDEWLALRRRNINSTEVPALFGLSPYMTAFELALTKAGKVDEAEVSSVRTSWGTRLQEAIARGIESDYHVVVAPQADYHEFTELRIGSSFDYEIMGKIDDSRSDTELRHFRREHGVGILEVKNLDPFMFVRDWKMVDGQLEAAPHIEIQLQHQLLLSGHKWGAIGVLVGGNSLRILIRMADADVHAHILSRCEQFWADLAADKYPPPQMPADAAMIAKLYNFGEPGTFLDGTGDPALAQACSEYIAASATAKAATEAKETARAGVLSIVQEHEKAVTAGYKISTWMVAPQHVEYDAAGYRSMRITEIKGK